MFYFIKIGVYASYIFLIVLLFWGMGLVVRSVDFSGISGRLFCLVLIFLLVAVMAYLLPRIEELMHKKYVKKQKKHRKS